MQRRRPTGSPFKRNDQMLEAMPVGVVVFPGNGVSGNLADKAKKLRIPVMRFDRDEHPVDAVRSG
jgi:hypothetical protein